MKMKGYTQNKNLTCQQSILSYSEALEGTLLKQKTKVRINSCISSMSPKTRKRKKKKKKGFYCLLEIRITASVVQAV